jgi:hypothetical protein
LTEEGHFWLKGLGSSIDPPRKLTRSNLMPKVMSLKPAVRSRILSKVREDLQRASRKWDVTLDKIIKDPGIYGAYLEIDEHVKTGGYLKSKKIDFEKAVIIDRGI